MSALRGVSHSQRTMYSTPTMTPDTNALRVALLDLMCITPCRDCDPCLGGRPDQCALFPPLDHNLIAQARGLLADRLGHIAYLQALHKMVGYSEYRLINATPDQHAAAILSALGKLPKDL